LTTPERKFILIPEGKMGFQNKIGFVTAASRKRKFLSPVRVTEFRQSSHRFPSVTEFQGTENCIPRPQASPKRPNLVYPLAEYRDRLAAKRRALNDTFETCTWYRDHWTDGNRNVLRGARG
jgi:hypothetical protein